MKNVFMYFHKLRISFLRPVQAGSVTVFIVHCDKINLIIRLHKYVSVILIQTETLDAKLPIIIFVLTK